MIDAGYNYERLAEKMRWLDIEPSSIKDILITHQDTDHIGAVERDSDGLFRQAKLYLGEIENRYMTGEKRRKVFFGLYKLPMVKSDNKRKLLKDGDVFHFRKQKAFDIKVQKKKIEQSKIANSASDSEFNWNMEMILGRDENEYTMIYRQCGLCYEII